MKLNDLRSLMLLADEEIVLNKSIVIKDTKVHFMSIRKVNGINTIWAVYEKKHTGDDGIIHMHDIEETSNRDTLYKLIDHNLETPHIHINKFMIQGEPFEVSSSSSSNIFINNMQSMIKLQHFLEADLLPSFLNDTKISDICIASYKQGKYDIFPAIDVNKEIEIKVKTACEHKTFLINKTHNVGFDKYSETVHTFYNPLNSKECTYYLQPLEICDIWNETKLMIEDDPFKDLSISDDQRSQMIQSLYQKLEHICPKGMKLAILKYETDDNISLNFRLKEYLDNKVQFKSSASAFLYSNDEEIGPNGLKTKICHVKAIDENDLSSIVIELVAFTVTIPGQTIDTQEISTNIK